MSSLQTLLLKKYNCKHIIGIAIINKDYVPPPHAKTELCPTFFYFVKSN